MFPLSHRRAGVPPAIGNADYCDVRHVASYLAGRNGMKSNKKEVCLPE